ncbi:MAG: DUF6273 domain-containing protein, partial [Synergistaceae bacterium]|nr:DUF6273 domain-containing protein [Synergistaceae bacterium]
ITVPSIPVIHLTPDPTALPDKVEFGKYNENPIEWSVLDIVNGKALLFAGALFQEQFDTRERRSEWANSTLRAHLNSNAAGGFLQGSNFTAEETAAIDAAASATGDLVFLLSIDEVYKYLPDANMRYNDDKEWLTRTSNGAEDVVAIRPDGEYGGGFEAYTRRQPAWIRPAIWVDLRLLRDNIDPKRQ